LLNEARSAVAVNLLYNVGLPVEEVSTRLGYSEVSTFSHGFKRRHGAAPSASSRRAPAAPALCPQLEVRPQGGMRDEVTVTAAAYGSKLCSI